MRDDRPVTSSGGQSLPVALHDWRHILSTIYVNAIHIIHIHIHFVQFVTGWTRIVNALEAAELIKAQ
jgi:hypothetical protein